MLKNFTNSTTILLLIFAIGIVGCQGDAVTEKEPIKKEKTATKPTAKKEKTLDNALKGLKRVANKQLYSNVGRINKTIVRNAEKNNEKIIAKANGPVTFRGFSTFKKFDQGEVTDVYLQIGKKMHKTSFGKASPSLAKFLKDERQNQQGFVSKVKLPKGRHRVNVVAVNKKKGVYYAPTKAIEFYVE